MGIQFQIRSEGGVTHVTATGTVDEHVDLSALDALKGRIELNLAGVRRFNSVGIRFWIDAMRALAARGRVECVECSRAVIDQVNMIRGFLGGATVRSFHVPMLCEHCDVEVDKLVRVEDCADGLPEVRCPKCSVPMELDDLEDNYLLFVREPTIIR